MQIVAFSHAAAHNSLRAADKSDEGRVTRISASGISDQVRHTGLKSHIKGYTPRSSDFKLDCTIREAKTKALISCTVTTQLICVFDFRMF